MSAKLVGPAFSMLLVIGACTSLSTVQESGASGTSKSKSSSGGRNGGSSSPGSTSASTSTLGSSSSTGFSSSGSSSSGSSSGSSTGSSGSSSGSSSTGAASSSGSGGSGTACLPPPTDGGCWSNEPDGGPCVTLADCAAGFMCSYTGCYTGTCVPEPAAPTLACGAVGQPCGPGEPVCCGECSGGSCAPWTPCGETAQTCQTDLDCCSDFACQAGTCQPTCQQLYGPCQTPFDCCYHEGLSCALVQGFSNAICYPGNPYQPRNQSGDPVLCGAPCSGWECQLGAACKVVGGVDPCAAAGMVCDGAYNVCRSPKTSFLPNNTTEPCQPFGEPCLPVANSNAQPVCIPLGVDGVFTSYCAQACATTADCISPIEFCGGDSDYGGSVCLLWDQCQASQFFGPCDAQDAGDGFCYPLDYGGGAQGYCIQATFDGGGPGDRCLFDFVGNRQVGGLCDPTDFCSPGGLCGPACNSGTSGTPGCSGGQQCFPWLVDPIFSTLPVEMGYCGTPCDFTSPDGGGCPRDSSGIQEKCYPQLILDLVDSPTGVCAAGAAAPVAAGQPCPYPLDGQLTAAGDPCTDGTLCFGANVVTTLRQCTQLCDKVGQSGGCPSGQLCQPMIVAGLSASPTHTGYCQ